MSEKNTQQIPLKPLWRILCAVIIVLVSLLFLWTQNKDDDYEISVIAATCEDAGYSLYTHKESGQVTVRDVVDPAGHQFGPWIEVTQSDGISCSVKTRSCAVCNAEENELTYPQHPIPVIALTGNMSGIGKKDEVNMTAEFTDNSTQQQFSCFATLKYQGHSSLNYEKKNYTLKFFSNENHDDKYKITFSHWNPENKYILKANYIDPSQCRNLVCADVWADLCASRDSLPDNFTTLSNYGAVDGFPIALYINSQFQGLYTMNLHKDDDLFQMESGSKHAIMICNYNDYAASTFRSKTTFDENSPWEVEFCGTENSSWAEDQLNELIEFVLTADDVTFRNELQQRLDVDSAIDYLIALYALGLTHNGVSDLILVSYGEEWFPSMYDMESAFGLNEDGTLHYSPYEYLPQKNATGWDSATGSLLWDRILNQYEDEIRLRYLELRNDILATEGIVNRVSNYIQAIPESLYQANGNLYPERAFTQEDQNEIITYITMRMQALDDVFLSAGGTKQ